jgi:hypothetical protein
MVARLILSLSKQFKRILTYHKDHLTWQKKCPYTPFGLKQRFKNHKVSIQASCATIFIPYPHVWSFLRSIKIRELIRSRNHRLRFEKNDMLGFFGKKKVRLRSLWAYFHSFYPFNSRKCLEIFWTKF